MLKISLILIFSAVLWNMPAFADQKKIKPMERKTQISEEEAINISMKDADNFGAYTRAHLEKDGWHVNSSYKSAKPGNFYLIDATTGEIIYKNMNTSQDWQTYTDTNNAFTFQYPMDWVVVMKPVTASYSGPLSVSLRIQPRALLENKDDKTFQTFLDLDAEPSLLPEALKKLPASPIIINGRKEMRYERGSGLYGYYIPIRGTKYMFQYDSPIPAYSADNHNIAPFYVTTNFNNKTIEEIIMSFRQR